MIVKILIAIMAVLHLYITWFEMFAWETKWKKIFSSFPDTLFAQTKSMAANQWLYNWFLAAGLIWSLCISDVLWANNIATFFLLCIAIAWIYGYFTVDKKIIFIQTIPAILTIVLLYIL